MYLRIRVRAYVPILKNGSYMHIKLLSHNIIDCIGCKENNC